MNKTVKVLITLGVFTLVVLYFVQACGNNKPVGSVCENFNSLLMQKTEEYFSNDLPQEDGDMKTATINELVAAGSLTLSDLEGVGTTCSGNVYVGKNGDNYYYSNDVTCGTCTTGNLYTTWSDWQDTLPNIINENSQVQVGIFYNYGKGELAYSDWSEWALTLNEIEEPTLPTGVTVANTEKEEKTQYSYRDGSFKWYKLSGGKEYYSSKYYETSPASGYSKDTATKTVARTEINPSKTALINSLTGLDYSSITTTTAYKLLTPQYKYSYNKPTGCTAYKPMVKCYKIEEAGIIMPPYTPDSNKAESDCKAQSNVTNCKVTPKSTTSGATYNFSANFYASFPNTGNQWSCTVSCSNINIALPENCSKSTLQKCLSATSYGGTVSYHSCRTGSTTTVVCYSSSSCPLKISEGTIGSCSSATLTTANPGTTTYEYGYTFDRISWGPTVVQGTCPSTYPIEEVTSTPSGECTSASTIKYTPYYLTKEGAEVTNINDADYLSDAKFAALGKSNYSKTSYSTTSDTAYEKGTCPSGTTPSTCTQSTVFIASIYQYKWYKTSSSTKIWYNGGEYSAIQPSGYQPDTSSANWGEWSTFSDTKATSTTTRQVKTQIMKRIRKSYMGSGTLYLDNFLPLGEFETKVGKTLAELSQDTSLIIQKKIMYRYRTLNIIQ